jgi:hypothetical protein
MTWVVLVCSEVFEQATWPYTLLDRDLATPHHERTQHMLCLDPPHSLACRTPQRGDTPMSDPPRSDDELILYTLIQIWALITGRVLRGDVSPEQLPDDELIGFWADPTMEAQA